ncbi:MAG: UDP-N-acetyl-D-glucosamine dehydrogenase [Marmoricola sp.]|nr:UDP-N-acetyl-D-glucosamine dehydrogenase [Marmoricola sp.]
MSRVMVVGLGYVGLPLAVRAAEVGHEVVGVDLDPVKISMMQECTSYVEDMTEERLRAVTADGRFVAALGWRDAAGAPPRAVDFDIAVIAVPTPLRGTVPDLTYVESAGRMVGQVLCRGAAVVLESTTYPGTTEGLLADALQVASGLVPSADFHLGFSPERIDPGNKVYTLVNTPKLVSATTPGGLLVIKGFYDSVVDTTVPVSSPRVAELAKVFENTQAYVNIALVNELSGICFDLGIDVHEMIDAAMTKGHSMARWSPGPGVGGHCLPIDPMYLAWQTRTLLGRPFRFAELADEINAGRPSRVVERAAELLNDAGLPVKGTEVLVLGVAYKPDVGDLRESPALDVVRELVARGALVSVSDPHVPDWTSTPMVSLEDLAGQIPRFPLTIVVTDHADFDYQKLAGSAQMVLDCRHAMPASANVATL